MVIVYFNKLCSLHNAVVLKSFRFCHDCGNVLDKDLQLKEDDSKVSHVMCSHAGGAATAVHATTTSSHAVSNNSQSQLANRVLPFDEFRKRKSNERVQHTTIKKQQKPFKKCLLQLG